MTSRARRLVAAAASTALLGLGAVACSSSSDDSGASDASRPAAASGGQADDQAAVPEAAAPQDAGADSLSYSADGAAVADTSGGTAVSGAVTTPERELEPTDTRSLIKRGNVGLSSTDVRRTLFAVRKVINENAGEVSDDDTQADAKGEPETALLTIRVPVENFDATLAALQVVKVDGTAVKLISATSTTKDVTSQVVDTDVRVDLQKRSIRRISLLLDRATSIRDVVNIERELASREAALGSLEKRQKTLGDQTARSTITVSVERPAEKKATTTDTKKDDDSGFATGLRNGWDAFQDVTTGLLTGAGALLPFALLALLVGVPLRVWLRRRQPRAAPTDAAAA